MIALFIKNALQDIADNRFLNAITVVTIGLSILIISSFALFFTNTNALLNSWKQGVRVLVYLKQNATDANRLDLRFQIQQLKEIQEVAFISKETALERLKIQMQHQSGLLANLEKNPLPDAFEIRIVDASRELHQVAALAKKIQAFPQVAEVEYGQHFIARFSQIIQIFKFVGYALVSLFCVAALFIIANTIRLVLYSRREEIEIMRLVGATDRFITAPFYIEGIILGGLGAILGLMALFAAYQLIVSKFQSGLSLESIEIQFLSIMQILIFLGSSMLVGLLGCFLSLKQFLKN